MSDIVSLTHAGSAAEKRHSERLNNKRLEKNLDQAVDSLEKSQSIYNAEIINPETSTERLGEIRIELHEGIENIERQADELKRNTGTISKSIGSKIAELSRETYRLQLLLTKKATITSDQMFIGLRNNSARAPSIASTTSSARSAARQKANEAKADLEAKKAQLEVLHSQQQQEELAQLNAEMERKRREIERTRLMGEIAAEARRTEILELAADEEDEESSVHRLITGKINIPSPTQLQETSLTPTHKEQLDQNRSNFQKPELTSPRRALSQCDSHASLAEAIVTAINNTKITPPQPFVFNGDLMLFTDWKTSFYELIDSRRGSPAEKLALLKSYVTSEI